jgi:hypothetical protein
MLSLNGGSWRLSVRCWRSALERFASATASACGPQSIFHRRRERRFQIESCRRACRSKSICLHRLTRRKCFRSTMYPSRLIAPTTISLTVFPQCVMLWHVQQMISTRTRVARPNRFFSSYFHTSCPWGFAVDPQIAHLPPHCSRTCLRNFFHLYLPMPSVSERRLRCHRSRGTMSTRSLSRAGTLFPVISHASRSLARIHALGLIVRLKLER